MDCRNGHLKYYITFVLLFQFVASIENPIIVSVEEGQLQGTKYSTRDGKSYFAFLGVPYATVNQRFEPPQPPVPWSGVRDATQYGSVCPQLVGQTNTLTGKYPIIVYFHGGGFMAGSGNLYGGSYFLDEDVILITLNYRLGALGFLSTGDSIIQGNAGLKDQNAALRWIKSNAHALGGDSNRISIMGESAGSASVSYHVLSPMSKGLYNYAVSMSGSALDPEHFERDPFAQAVDLGESLGCPTYTSEELADCLRQTDFRKIVQIKLTKWHLDPLVAYPPTIETLREGQSETDVFLMEEPLVLLQEGRFNRVPYVIGLTEEEGLLFHSAYILQKPELQRNMNEDWNYIAPITLYYDKRYIPDEERNQISRTIRGFYFGGRKVEPNSSRNLTNLYSDRLFNWGTRTAALLQAKFAPVYTYIFGYIGDFTMLQLYYKDLFQGPIAATHGDDLQYFFNSTRYPYLRWDTRSTQMSRALIRLWASFATTG
ncbi:Esterase E4 [Orchesella cincta]|uniref:Esterase E4 n=1 Tax=Orchesella cincta TaxID=48709 RepID=A0A1D2NJM4_ORCCI|nr:Esterase E4 [Orchesella cincta]